MGLAVRLSLLASGLFLLSGMLTGLVKYRKTMTSPTHRSPTYVDIAHRAALLYSFAMLVIAKLLEYSPFSNVIQMLAAGAVVFFFAASVGGYLVHGLKDDTENIFEKRNFLTTWYMYGLMAGEIGGLAVILWGFISTQLIGR